MYWWSTTSDESVKRADQVIGDAFEPGLLWFEYLIIQLQLAQYCPALGQWRVLSPEPAVVAWSGTFILHFCGEGTSSSAVIALSHQLSAEWPVIYHSDLSSDLLSDSV